MGNTHKLYVTLWASVLLLPAPLRAQQVKSPHAPVVAVDSGRLVGAHFGAAPQEIMFLGVPYAAPPVGERRWRPPLPVAHWKKIYHADAFAPSCPKPADDVRRETDEVSEYGQNLADYKNFRTSEDCLYLNIWTTNLSAKSREPVMVWLHGGGGVSRLG